MLVVALHSSIACDLEWGCGCILLVGCNHMSLIH